MTKSIGEGVSKITPPPVIAALLKISPEGFFRKAILNHSSV
jgi:hypothetical protein